MKLELQKKLFEQYHRFFRKPGKRLVLAEAPPTIPVDVIGPAGVQHFEWHGKAPSEDYLDDDASVFDHRGIECGDGWFQLVDAVAYAFEHEIEAMITQGIPKERWPRLHQCKEKFGLLTVYVGVTGEMPVHLAAALGNAHEGSARTCESCGSPGVLRPGGWIHVHCDTCEAGRLAQKARPFDGMISRDYERHERDLRALLEARAP